MFSHLYDCETLEIEIRFHLDGECVVSRMPARFFRVRVCVMQACSALQWRCIAKAGGHLSALPSVIFGCARHFSAAYHVVIRSVVFGTIICIGGKITTCGVRSG